MKAIIGVRARARPAVQRVCRQCCRREASGWLVVIIGVVGALAGSHITVRDHGSIGSLGQAHWANFEAESTDRAITVPTQWSIGSHTLWANTP